MNLPPFGRQWELNTPSAGLWVCLGPGAWERAQSRNFPCLVLPDDSGPNDYRWPTNNQPAFIIETGDPNDIRLWQTARAILQAGSPKAVAYREGTPHMDSQVWFEFEGGDTR